MEKYSYLNVFSEGRRVGTLAIYHNRLCAFEYSAEWLEGGYSISPYSLPLRKQVFIPSYDPFDGLFGVFNDSLPDGWGRLLVDRMLLSNGMHPEELGPLERLAIVGGSGMGALEYRPEFSLMSSADISDYDRFAAECRRLLETDYSPDLDSLFALGGSSGGARPKIMTEIDGEDWIIKFPSSGDADDIGMMEYMYSLCAKKCGIEVPEVRLFPSRKCEGYFGCRRFDRVGSKRIHMISVSGLLETSHRIPALDYEALLRLTLNLTKDYSEVWKMFRLMCFNVFAHNRDDHSRNFSFIFEDGRWRLSPAYDLTYSNSIGGEHATCVHGNGRSPDISDILAVAGIMELPAEKAKETAESIRDMVHSDLHKWL